MREIYVSKIDSFRRLDHICTAVFYLAFGIFILLALSDAMGHETILSVSIFEIIMLMVIFSVFECMIFHKVIGYILSAFNILIIKDSNIITYIDSRFGYGKPELDDELILRNNKNSTIEVTGTLFIQPVCIHIKKKDYRSYTFIGTYPPFNGNALICDGNQIIMRESSVFLSALKEKFEYVEMEPLVREIKQMSVRDVLFK